MKRNIILTLTVVNVAILLAGLFSFNSGYLSGVSEGYALGQKEGYESALIDVGNLAQIDFRWSRLENGSYRLEVYSGAALIERFSPRVDLVVEHRRNGEIVSVERHAGVLTNLGKDWIEQQLSGTISANITKYIACSADTAAGMSVASTKLTNEIAANGFTRAAGTYASTGVGAWTVSKTFTSSGTQTVQLYSLEYSPTSLGDNSLFCYDTSSAKNTVTSDTVAVTWTVSVT